MEQDILQMILTKLDKLEEGQQGLKEELMLQGHKLSLEIQELRRERNEKLDALLESSTDNRMLIDGHEPRLVKLEGTVDTLVKDVDTLKAAAN